MLNKKENQKQVKNEVYARHVAVWYPPSPSRCMSTKAKTHPFVFAWGNASSQETSRRFCSGPCKQNHEEREVENWRGGNRKKPDYGNRNRNRNKPKPKRSRVHCANAGSKAYVQSTTVKERTRKQVSELHKTGKRPARGRETERGRLKSGLTAGIYLWRIRRVAVLWLTSHMKAAG